ncbi:MAG: hypothetical protein JWQ59_1145 [Cryobacterium sp.]|jgi:hypothetical protein|nr:hypothetical protein [Cryobacterium sp.]
MSIIERENATTIVVELAVHERMLLAGLLEQLVDVLFDDADPAMKRLLPDAYRDDPESAAEFRRFTAEGLAERKIANARTVLDVVGNNLEGVQEPEDRSIVLDEFHAVQWLRALSDLRLTIANRLGIETDDDEGRLDGVALPLQHTYYWLGDLQEALVQALSD